MRFFETLPGTIIIVLGLMLALLGLVQIGQDAIRKATAQDSKVACVCECAPAVKP